MKKTTEEIKGSVENLLKKRQYVPKERENTLIDPQSTSGSKYERLFSAVNNQDQSKDIFRYLKQMIKRYEDLKTVGTA